MKRMVLIPEEKLIRYENQMNEQIGDVQPPTNGQTGGIHPPIHYPAGNYPGHNYLYNYPKYPGSMMGGGEDGGEETDSLSVEMIVRGIPKTMKSRAEALLAHLKEREDIITWDEMGQVLLNGVLIPKSNITDLVSDAMRYHKNFNPVGVQEFYKALKEMNIPKDIVRNETRWTEGEKEEKEELNISNWLTL